jgi:hypothetical protein
VLPNSASGYSQDIHIRVRERFPSGPNRIPLARPKVVLDIALGEVTHPLREPKEFSGLLDV